MRTRITEVLEIHKFLLHWTLTGGSELIHFILYMPKEKHEFSGLLKTQGYNLEKTVCT